MNVTTTEDIECEFLQNALTSDESDAVRFLWVTENSDAELEVLSNVFGARSSSFLLNAIIKHHKNYKDVYPASLSILNSRRYVYDMIHSVEDTDLACKIHEQMNFILREAVFNIRKWTPNVSLLQDRFTEEVNYKSMSCKVLEHCRNSADGV